MNWHEGSAWWLLLLLVVPLLWWPILKRRRRPALRFSSIELLRRAPSSWAAHGRVLLTILRTATVMLLIVCLARPQKGDEQTRVFAEGVAIQLLVDRSGSMQAMDFHVDGEAVDRLTAVKKVVDEFVLGDGELPGRKDDLVGLIVFGTFADSLCPLTLDHDHMINTLSTVEIGTTEQEGQTAIGDAIALAVERLRMLEERRDMQTGMKIRSKVIILLTDGENTAGEFEPLQAAEMAAAFGIKIYTIGAGTTGMAPIPTTDFFGNRVLRPMQVRIDEDTLRSIADITGGRYFRATDTNSLVDVYAKIDELEKTKIEERRFMQYKELATASVDLGFVRLPPLLLIAAILLALEVVLANTRLRRVP